MSIYHPMTPAGTLVTWIKADSFQIAVDLLLEDASHMPYDGWAGFYERGYRIYKLNGSSLIKLDLIGAEI